MDEGIDPQNMCSHLYGTLGILHQLSTQTSKGLVIIFQEWLEEVERECASILEREPGCSTERMARLLGIPGQSAAFIMERIKAKEEQNYAGCHDRLPGQS